MYKRLKLVLISVQYTCITLSDVLKINSIKQNNAS